MCFYRTSFVTLSLLSLLISTIANSAAKDDKFQTRATTIVVDEDSFRGQGAAISVEDSPVIIIAWPNELDSISKQAVSLEVGRLDAFVSEGFKQKYVYQSVNSGFIEINKYEHRYIIDTNKLVEPVIILTEDYWDTMPVMAKFNGENSFVEEVKTYFNVKSEKQFKRMVDKRIKRESIGDGFEQKSLLSKVMQKITTKISPTLTTEQAMRVNSTILGRTDMISGFTFESIYFDKPFKQLNIIIESGNEKGNDSIIKRNEQQQRTFSHVKTYAGDTYVYKEHFYNENGVLERSRAKQVRQKHDLTRHTMDYVFWNSDYTVNVYKIRYRGFASDLEHIQVESFTFDEDYRPISLEVRGFNSDTLTLNESGLVTKTEYNGDYDYVLKQHVNGVENSDSQLKFSHQDGLLTEVEVLVANELYRLDKVNGNVTVSTDGDGQEVNRVERIYQNDYLVGSKRDGSLWGERSIRFEYQQ